MIYFDTSFLLPLCHEEIMSGEILDVLSQYRNSEAILSDWTITEFYSALGCLVRDKKMSAAQANSAVQQLARRIKQGLVTYRLDMADQEQAQSIMSEWKKAPKAGDALHLAVALRLGAQLLTLDKAMARIATLKSIPVMLVKK
jgi:uncharacterized protein